MNKIYKYEIEIKDNQSIMMPREAQILCVQMQAGKPCIWALANPELAEEKYYFELFGTGHEIQDGMGTSRKYIGTFQMLYGNLIYHLFHYTGI